MDKVTDINKGKPVKDLVADQDKPDVTRILVEYSDGSTKEVHKGAVVTEKPIEGNLDQLALEVEFKDMKGDEVFNLMQGLFVIACQILQITADDEAPENEE